MLLRCWWGGVGWGGVGGHVNVPCTSYMKYCHAADISGIVYYVIYVATLLMGWGGVGWGGMLTFLVLRAWNIATLLRSLGSFTTLHVATLLMGWGGVGWGGMLTFLVLRTWRNVNMPPPTPPHNRDIQKRAFYGNGFRSAGIYIYNTCIYIYIVCIITYIYIYIHIYVSWIIAHIHI